MRDNSIGIAPELCKILFRPFFMTKPTEEGTGLLGKANDHAGKLDIPSALPRPAPGSPSSQAATTVDRLCPAKSLGDFALTGGEGKKDRRAPHSR